MSRLIRILLILIVLVVGAAFIIPPLIPATAYRDQVQAAAREALNRDVILAGDISLALLPQVQVRARDVRIANEEGFGDEAFAEMGEMRVAVALLPLLSRTIEIQEFVLVDPSIRLTQRGNRNNWTFSPADAAAAAAAPASNGGFRRPGALPIETTFGDVRIENASITFDDGVQTRRISGLDLAVALPSLDQPVLLTGSLNADGEALEFGAEIASLRDFFEGRATPFSLDLGGQLISFSFDGEFLEAADLAFTGRTTLDVPSLRRLAAFAGTDIPPGEQLRDLSASGALTVQPGRIDLAADRLRLDDIAATGAVTVELDRARPRIRGNLEVPELDVTPYLPDAPAEPAANTGVPPWSEDRIDLAGLGIVDAQIRINADRFQFRDIEITNTALRFEIKNRRLETVLRNFTLYGGTGRAEIVANGRRSTPSFSLEGQLTGLDAQPFLIAAAGFERLQGTGTMNFDFLASGASQAEIMNSIDGSGRFSFTDGAIVGINIAETIRNVNSFFAAPNASGSSDDSEQASTGDNQSTDFSELSGTFTMSNGRAENRDLAMLSPLLRVAGEGWVNLPEQTLDYRLRPRAVASIQGQGGDRDMRGIVVPVRIRGTFNDVGVGVDTEAVGQALLSGALSNALGGSGQASSPEDMLRDGLMNALGIGGNDEPAEDGDAASEQPQEEDVDPAEQLLRGLLSRGRSSSSNEDDDGNGNR